MLKFRLPYTDGTTKYFDGEVRLPVWGPQTTTECRLLVNCDSTSLVDYDHQKLLEQLFYFNTVVRISIYPRKSVPAESRRAVHSTLLAAGLCQCFDCSREVEIISAYLRSRGGAAAGEV